MKLRLQLYKMGQFSGALLPDSTSLGELTTLPERIKIDAKKVKHTRYGPINQR